MLAQIEGKTLLKIAVNAINKKRGLPKDNFLKEKKGVFVTLTMKGELRGCIGLPFPVKPLGEAVIEAAESAAYADPRFPPISEDEKKDLVTEVSVLSTPVPVKLEDIKKGDGVILEYGFRNALFLPQVWEELPGKQLFLEQLSIKAGLNPDDYKKANFKKFSVQAFKTE
ncbi:Uncharacterised protein [Candidatus Tiddalikarchaeum anstoanum]|nr:Uncharacterised protein [Candidatus Tiddalikarchaeum anstoanum]